jgi:hypothetical protein
MEEQYKKSIPPTSIVETVFADFVLQLQKENAINANVATALKKVLAEKHYSAEKLKQALFSEDSL